jgi:hypothetical protein
LLRLVEPESSCLREAGVEKEEEEYIARRYDSEDDDSRTGTGDWRGDQRERRMAVALAASLTKNPSDLEETHFFQS